MRYRTLGRTGIQVTPYALGTMNFGTLFNTSEEDGIRVIRRALDGGINLLDTADNYSQGQTEEIVAKAVAGRRDDVVIATKFSNPMGDSPNRRGGSRRWITRAVEDSLRRLNTDYIDIYQYHRPDVETDLEETLSALTDLVRSGKVRAIGTSRQPATDIVEAQWISEKRGYERVRCEQPTYSILNRGIERDVLPAAQRFGMGVIVFSPLGQGMLTGRVRKGQASELTRSGPYFAHLEDERRLDAVEQLALLADKSGISMTHMAVAFAVAHPGVTSAIVGPRTVEQLDDILAGADVTLPDDVLDAIDEIVPPGTDLGSFQMAFHPPAITTPSLRRRPAETRGAA